MKTALAALAVGQLSRLVTGQGAYGGGVAGVTEYYPVFDLQFCTQPTTLSGLVSSSSLTGSSALGTSTSNSLSSTIISSTISISTTGSPSSSTTSSSASASPATPQYLLSINYGSSPPPAGYGYYKEKRQTGNGFYLGASGSETSQSCLQGAAFQLTSGGQLTSNGQYVSTSSGTGCSPFTTGPTNASSITTIFSMNENSTLEWTNNAFQPLGYAQFCASGGQVFACFSDQYPSGCQAVTISAESTSDCPGYGQSSSPSSFSGNSPGSTATSGSSMSFTSPSQSLSSAGSGSSASGTTSSSTQGGASSGTSTSSTLSPSSSGSIYYGSLTGTLQGCFGNNPASPALAGPNETVTTLEQCLAFCVSYSLLSVANGDVCTCANAYTLYAQEDTYPMSACNTPCTGASSETCGGQNVAQVYEISGDTTTVYGSSGSPSISSPSTASSSGQASGSSVVSNSSYVPSGSSFNPSSVPSNSPHNNPSVSPSVSPSLPSNSPYIPSISASIPLSGSSNPVYNPSISPSVSLSVPSNPAHSYSFSPSISPSVLPNSLSVPSASFSIPASAPSLSPSLPSNSFSIPSFSPSMSVPGPSISPSVPSFSPSIPSSAPSISYSVPSASSGSSISISPSVNPSASSFGPSGSPSASFSASVVPSVSGSAPSTYPTLDNVGNPDATDYYGLCPEYWGGQYSTGNSTLYEINCYSRANYMEDAANVNGNPSSFSGVDYETCVANCDAYNAWWTSHGGSQGSTDQCAAITWFRESIVGTGNNNCYLHAVTNGGGTNVENAPSSGYITSILIPNEQSELYLSDPIPLVTNTWLNGFNEGQNSTVPITIPNYTFDIFGTQSDTVYVSANGFISILPTGATSPTTQQMSTADTAGTIPANNNDIPDETLFALWTNSFPTPVGATQYEGSQLGIYYQVNDNVVSFEFLLGEYGTGQQVDYHYIVTYDQTQTSQWYIYYFEVDVPSSLPPTFTVGAQGGPGGVETINIAQQVTDGSSSGPSAGTIYHLDTSAPGGLYYSGTFTPNYNYGTWPNSRPAGAGHAAGAKKRGKTPEGYKERLQNRALYNRY